MAEVVHLVIKKPQFQERGRSKLPNAVSGIPLVNLEQEIADALKMDIKRRLELKSKIDELSTKELERLL